MTYSITTNKADMDIDAIHKYLFRSYWAENVPKKIVAMAIDNSLCFADFATMAYLSDVYILEEHRGKGLSKKIMAEIISHPQLQGLRRLLLATSDAHGLYEQFGFTKLANPDFLWNCGRPIFINERNDRIGFR